MSKIVLYHFYINTVRNGYAINILFQASISYIMHVFHCVSGPNRTSVTPPDQDEDFVNKLEELIKCLGEMPLKFEIFKTGEQEFMAKVMFKLKYIIQLSGSDVKPSKKDAKQSLADKAMKGLFCLHGITDVSKDFSNSSLQAENLYVFCSRKKFSKPLYHIHKYCYIEKNENDCDIFKVSSQFSALLSCSGLNNVSVIEWLGPGSSSKKSAKQTACREIYKLLSEELNLSSLPVAQISECPASMLPLAQISENPAERSENPATYSSRSIPPFRQTKAFPDVEIADQTAISSCQERLVKNDDIASTVEKNMHDTSTRNETGPNTNICESWDHDVSVRMEKLKVGERSKCFTPTQDVICESVSLYDDTDGTLVNIHSKKSLEIESSYDQLLRIISEKGLDTPKFSYEEKEGSFICALSMNNDWASKEVYPSKKLAEKELAKFLLFKLYPENVPENIDRCKGVLQEICQKNNVNNVPKYNTVSSNGGFVSSVRFEFSLKDEISSDNLGQAKESIAKKCLDKIK